MPEYLAPGVYIEEIESGPKPIEGVSTSTVGMVGMAVRGPITGLPQLVTSFADYQRRYGTYLPDGLGASRFLPHAVRAFFENGGQRVFITRVRGTGDATASGTPATGVITRLAQNLLGGSTTATLVSLRGVGVAASTPVTFTQVRDGVTITHAANITGYNSALNQVTLDTAPPGGTDFDARFTSVALIVPGGPFPALVAITAADPGDWGNHLDIRITPASLGRANVVSLSESVPASGNFDAVRLTTVNGFYPGAIVEFDRGSSGSANDRRYHRVTTVSGSSIIITPPLAAAGDLNPNAPATVTVARTAEFSLTASYNGLTETFPALTLDNTTPHYYEDVINNGSNLVRVSGGSATETNPFRFPAGANGLTVVLTGGLDGTAPGDAVYVGTDLGPGNRTGIQALIDIDEVSIVAVPGITSQTVQNALIVHCETLQDRFAILDPVYNLNSALDDIQAQRSSYDTFYAALYFPNLRALDPASGLEIILPPSGHVAGLYAKTDEERGVHKAPANVVVRGITGLELTINKGEQDILNPRNINVNRDFRSSNRGFRVWGARCLTSDASWRYVPVRRLFIFVEESLQEGLQWVVFEPNDEILWARVRQSITNFLVRVWRDGALMGLTQEEAFFVRCDRTTMTQDDIDNGRLIVQVGIAPVRPAEFVIIRIQQYTAEANVTS